MTPQSNLMILAAIDPPREAELRALLASMNRSPGVVDPLNPLLPFARLTRVHFARIVILDDQTTGDMAVYGLPVVNYPKYLAVIVDFDGTTEALLDELIPRAGDVFPRIFSHCEGYTPGVDLRSWIESHRVAAAAAYVNWIGRTVQQVREEEALRQTLENFIREKSPALQTMQPRQARDTLKKFVAGQQQSGFLTL